MTMRQLMPKARIGQAFISSVDSAYYRGSFQFFEAAQVAGFKPPVAHPFFASHFSGYIHTNTLDDDSALSKGTACQTWVFSKE